MLFINIFRALERMPGLFFVFFYLIFISIKHATILSILKEDIPMAKDKDGVRRADMERWFGGRGGQAVPAAPQS
jgi:hypothetical protein